MVGSLGYPRADYLGNPFVVGCVVGLDIMFPSHETHP